MRSTGIALVVRTVVVLMVLQIVAGLGMEADTNGPTTTETTPEPTTPTTSETTPEPTTLTTTETTIEPTTSPPCPPDAYCGPDNTCISSDIYPFYYCITPSGFVCPGYPNCILGCTDSNGCYTCCPDRIPTTSPTPISTTPASCEEITCPFGSICVMQSSSTIGTSTTGPCYPWEGCTPFCVPATTTTSTTTWPTTFSTTNPTCPTPDCVYFGCRQVARPGECPECDCSSDSCDERIVGFCGIDERCIALSESPYYRCVPIRTETTPIWTTAETTTETTTESTTGPTTYSPCPFEAYCGPGNTCISGNNYYYPYSCLSSSGRLCPPYPTCPMVCVDSNRCYTCDCPYYSCEQIICPDETICVMQSSTTSRPITSTIGSSSTSTNDPCYPWEGCTPVCVPETTTIEPTTPITSCPTLHDCYSTHHGPMLDCMLFPVDNGGCAECQCWTGASPCLFQDPCGGSTCIGLDYYPYYFCPSTTDTTTVTPTTILTMSTTSDSCPPLDCEAYGPRCSGYDLSFRKCPVCYCRSDSNLSCWNANNCHSDEQCIQLADMPVYVCVPKDTATTYTCDNVRCGADEICIIYQRHYFECPNSYCIPEPTCFPRLDTTATTSATPTSCPTPECQRECLPILDVGVCPTCVCPNCTCEDLACGPNDFCLFLNVECPADTTPCPPQPACAPLRTTSPCPMFKCAPDCVPGTGSDGCPTCECPPSCKTVKCSAGYECQLVNVTCITEPCFPQPQCLPAEDPCSGTPNRRRCGGRALNRWTYNSKTDACEKFTYYGCTQSPNTFNSPKACKNRCKPDCSHFECEEDCYTLKRKNRCPRCICPNPCKALRCRAGYECKLRERKCHAEPEPFCARSLVASTIGPTTTETTTETTIETTTSCPTLDCESWGGGCFEMDNYPECPFCVCP